MIQLILALEKLVFIMIVISDIAILALAHKHNHR